MSETTLILGASSDIGLSLIERLLPGPGTIVAHFNASRKKLDRFSREIGAGKIVPVGADLSDPSAVEDLFAAVEAKGAPSRIVHLPAPKIAHIRFHELEWSRLEHELNVQLRSIVFLLGKWLPKMAKAKRGKVLFVLSSYVLGLPPKYMSHYVTVKHALLGLMASLAAEYADKGVCLNAVSPSLTETSFLKEISDKIPEMSAAQHPMKRNALPADLVPMMAMLLSEETNYITGVNIPIAGGSVA
jgi:3-oxoacyl-[acyl-carrier protein] reductase